MKQARKILDRKYKIHLTSITVKGLQWNRNDRFDHYSLRGWSIKEACMGDKGGKKNKEKADKQKKEQIEKKKEQQKSKLPTKKL